MKHVFAVLFACLSLVGCREQPQPNTIIVNPPPKAEAPAPPIPPTPPPQPLAPSRSFLHGYNDGYAGSWLGPARWAVVNDYRHGWQSGAYDRQHGLPRRYPPTE